MLLSYYEEETIEMKSMKMHLVQVENLYEVYERKLEAEKRGRGYTETLGTYQSIYALVSNMPIDAVSATLLS